MSDMNLFSFYKCNTSTFSPILIKNFGAFDGIFLSALIQICNTSVLMDDYFEYIPQNITELTGFTSEQQLNAINDLVEHQVITIKYEGVPLRHYIKIEEDKLLPLYNVLSDNEKAKATNISNIAQFKRLSKSPTKGKNKFQQMYKKATEKFSDKDLLDLLYKYLQERIGAISYNQWDMCLKHLSEYGMQYPPSLRKVGMLCMVEKAIGGGWFDFYKISDYELQQLSNSGFNQFGEPVNNNTTNGEVDEWGKNKNFDLALDENGNPIKF